MRRQDVGGDDEEPLHDGARRHDELLHDDERHDVLLLQHGNDGELQDGADGHGVRHVVHQRRQRLPEDDSSLLRLHDGHDDAGQHLLRDDERNADRLHDDVIRVRFPGHR